MKVAFTSELHPDVRQSIEAILLSVPEVARNALGDVTVAVGFPRPDDVPPGQGPLVVIPLSQHGVVRQDARAIPVDCLAPLDAADALAVPAGLRGLPLVVLGLPRPIVAPDRSGPHVDLGDAPEGVRRTLAERFRHVAQGDAWISWVAGYGGRSLARTSHAIARGRVVVTLAEPVGPPPTFAGAVLSVGGPLEAIEATELLLQAPALSHALAAAGRKRLERLPAPKVVAERLLEAAVLARERHELRADRNAAPSEDLVRAARLA